MDDILVTGTDVEETQSLKEFLDSQFNIKDLGSLYFLLGIEAVRKYNGILLTQQKFTIDTLADFYCEKLKSFLMSFTSKNQTPHR